MKRRWTRGGRDSERPPCSLEVQKTAARTDDPCHVSLIDGHGPAMQNKEGDEHVCNESTSSDMQQLRKDVRDACIINEVPTLK